MSELYKAKQEAALEQIISFKKSGIGRRGWSKHLSILMKHLADQADKVYFLVLNGVIIDAKQGWHKIQKSNKQAVFSKTKI